jgi:DNA-directed RNA polymerase alpha subunit
LAAVFHGKHFGVAAGAMTQAWDFVDARILWQQGSTILDQRIDQSDLSVRTKNCLHNWEYQTENGKRFDHPINTVGELITFSEMELLRVPNLGRKSLKELKGFLQSHGLRLAESSWR